MEEKAYPAMRHARACDFCQQRRVVFALDLIDLCVVNIPAALGCRTNANLHELSRLFRFRDLT
jgi:hypothetical protein